MKSLKATLPPGFRFDREEANERSEPGQQSAQASAQANAEARIRLQGGDHDTRARAKASAQSRTTNSRNKVQHKA
jgi:hypothetical protein